MRNGSLCLSQENDREVLVSMEPEPNAARPQMSEHGSCSVRGPRSRNRSKQHAPKQSVKQVVQQNNVLSSGLQSSASCPSRDSPPDDPHPSRRPPRSESPPTSPRPPSRARSPVAYSPSARAAAPLGARVAEPRGALACLPKHSQPLESTGTGR